MFGSFGWMELLLILVIVLIIFGAGSVNGLPDTIAYLTEEEIMAARSGLEKLGYEREALHAALAVPPQGVDYSHVFFRPS